MKTMKHSLFPTQVYQISVEENDTLKQSFLPHILNVFGDDEHVPSGWVETKVNSSCNNTNLNQTLFQGQTLLDQVQAKALQSVFEDAPANLKFGVTSRWCNIYKKGEYQSVHSHSQFPECASFSFIHFLSFDPDRHSPVQFYDPLAPIRATNAERTFLSFRDYFTPILQEGDMIVFPSYLLHAVSSSPNSLDYPRVTISGNIRCWYEEGQTDW